MNVARLDGSQHNGSRGDFAYNAIRDAIVNGRYNAGDRVRENEIAVSMGTSRTPVRDALRRLEAEGLLVAAPRRGLVVTQLNEHQLADLFAVRAALASLAARLAAEHATPIEVATMRDVLKREGSTGSKDLPSLLRTNNVFHQLVYRAARNPYLNQVLRSLETSLALVPGRTFLGSNSPALAVRQHRELVDAIEARDPDRAETCARVHMEASERILQSMVSSANVAFDEPAIAALPGRPPVRRSRGSDRPKAGSPRRKARSAAARR